MAWTFVGLGNPGKEYDGTRHNVGREFLHSLAKKQGIDSWKEDKKLKALVAKGEWEGEKVVLILPETFMNNSGISLRPIMDTQKKMDKLVVIHDELDMPLGKVKISVGSGPGGHNGVLSIQKALKSKNFARIRIGISPKTPSGKIKKPDGAKVVDFVIGKFKGGEDDDLKRMKKIVNEALKDFVEEGTSRAMTNTNSK